VKRRTPQFQNDQDLVIVWNLVRSSAMRGAERQVRIARRRAQPLPFLVDHAARPGYDSAEMSADLENLSETQKKPLLTTWLDWNHISNRSPGWQ
jgi:hypothetical protein